MPLWQIPLDENSKGKAVVTIFGWPLYRFVTMPFGLCKAPQTNSLIVSVTFNEHLQTLSEIDLCIRNPNLTINFKKNKFLQKQMKYLGPIIDHGII